MISNVQSGSWFERLAAWAIAHKKNIAIASAFLGGMVLVISVSATVFNNGSSVTTGGPVGAAAPESTSAPFNPPEWFSEYGGCYQGNCDYSEITRCESIGGGLVSIPVQPQVGCVLRLDTFEALIPKNDAVVLPAGFGGAIQTFAAVAPGGQDCIELLASFQVDC